MSRTLLAFTIAAVFASGTVPGLAQQAPQAPPPLKPNSLLDSLRTVAESSDYRSTSTYAEVVGFMKKHKDTCSR